MQKKKYNPTSSLALTIGTFILYIIAEYYSHDIDILSLSVNSILTHTNFDINWIFYRI